MLVLIRLNQSLIVTIVWLKDLTKSPIFGFDPLPPIDSIISYSRPQKPEFPPQVSDQGLLSIFLRSWLPDFNVEDLAAGGHGLRNRVMARNDAAGAEAGAVGGQRGTEDTSDLRRSVTSLLDAMRDLLSNIHMADVPNEGDVSSEDDDDGEPHDWLTSFTIPILDFCRSVDTDLWSRSPLF